MRKVCLSPGCPEPAPYRGRCVYHARQRDRSINRAGKKIYNSRKWCYTRRRKLSESPICEWDGCGAIASDVHHVVSLGEGGDPWALSNLSAMCHSHHSVLTRREMSHG